MTQGILEFRPTLRHVASFCAYHSNSEANVLEGISGKLFHSLASVKDFFQQRKYQDKPQVRELLDLYAEVMDEAKYFRELDLTSQKKLPKQPLITFEGLDGTGKSTQVEKLTKYLDSEYYHTPPQYLNDLKAKFTKFNVVERTAFYTLANYMAALDLLKLLRNKTVVLDRYWHSTSAYAIAQEIKDNPNKFLMPAKQDPIFEWPKDLLKPDLVVLLHVREDVRRFRQFSRRNITQQEHMLNTNKDYRKNAVEAFLRMRNPGVIPIDSNLHQDKVFESIKTAIEPLGIVREEAS